MKKNLISFRILLLIIAWAFAATAFAQEIQLTGKITDAKDGSTLPGATVLVKGTTTGTLTDIDGNYSLKVKTGATLVFSFIGYTPQEVVITTQKMLNIALASEAHTLDEVLVIGYGTQKKSDRTGAIAHVTAAELNQGSLTDPIQGLQGKASGVVVTKKGGDPNSGFAVRIRGSAGFDSNTQPLFVIDGIPNADPTAIAPEDIESYNILKDAASTAIYGSQGANGVIIITTKKGSSKGKNGGSLITINSKTSFDKVANTLNVLNADELRGFADTKLQAALPVHPTWTVDSIFKDGGANTDWQNEIYRLGMTTDNNLSFSGGSEKSTYYASVTHAKWEGVMKGTEKKRTSAKLNLSHKAFNDKLTLSGNLTSSFENNDYENYGGWGKDDIIYQAISHNPTDPVYNADGSYNKTQREFNYENPIATINEVTNIRDAKSFTGNLKADWIIINGLTASVNGGYLRNDNEANYFRPSGLYASADNGYARRSYSNNYQSLFDATLNYVKKIDKNNFDAVLGYSWQESGYDGFSAQATNAQSPYSGPNNLGTMVDVKYGDIASYKGMSRLIGMFGRVQYNYNSKYYLSGSIRRDGSTKFGENNKWGWFPTAAIGWNMQNEDFLSSVSWIDQLKLRGSYGVSGNQNIGEYRSQVAWQPGGLATNPETGQQVVSFQPAWNANPDLKWERTAEVNIGVDFAFLNNRFSGSLEVYQKNTSDLLGAYKVPVPPNLSQTTFANSGSIQNKGIELFFQAFVVDHPDFTWKTSLTASHNKSEFTDLGQFSTDENGVRHEGYISGRGMVGDEYWVTGVAVGHEVGAFYLPVYVALLDGEFIYESKSGGYTSVLGEAKRDWVGSANAKVELGWTNNFTFLKNWSADFSFRSMIGNKVYNATKSFFDVPQNMPSLNGLPDAIDWYNQGRSKTGATIADFYMEDASFVRLDYISLGYQFDTKKLDWITNLKLFVVANNLFIVTGYSGIDPETSMNGLSYGIDQYNVYPKTRTFTFGINASF
ncbi:MAG: SusC/RagA family TonB-linked outer membrane protein [Bacteroidota bacterium]